LKNHRLNKRFPAKYDFWLTVLGIPIVALLVNTLLFGFLLQENNYLIFFQCIWLSLGFTALYWFTFRFIFHFYTNRFPLEADNKSRRIKILVTFLLIFIILQIVIEVLMKQFFSNYMPDFQPHLILKIITSLLFSFLIVFIYEIIFLSTQIAHVLEEKEALKKESIASELSGLKEQINPHFLFNSLNTLSSLIATDVIKAESFVSKLAKVYRYILDKSSEDLVTLDQELTYLESYIHLLKERFGDSLMIHMDKLDDVRRFKKIIPLSLQICFENCVKHNIVTNENPLFVSIDFSKENYIFITNNIQKLQLNEPSSGVGINNIKKRYSFFTDLPIIINQDEKQFSIGLPLI